ncbi:hypothetical protein [Latilactobacillus sakei]|uniref:hypothetical protein n=1 Tax=Latilactobacillus sakei TaxID=1599 RepID=UPI0009755909|nr:hypothetical protein [Latilactobacillus sakei]
MTKKDLKDVPYEGFEEHKKKKEAIKRKMKQDKIRLLFFKYGLPVLVIGITPLAIAMLMNIWPFKYIPGENSDWFSFWGGYLGSIITILFAVYTARTQAEKAIEDTRKAETAAYHDKAKLDKIFNIQEELVGIYFKIVQLRDRIKENNNLDMQIIVKEIEEIKADVAKSDQNIVKLQFYLVEEMHKYKDGMLVIVQDDEKENPLGKLLASDRYDDRELIDLNIITPLDKFNEKHISKQIRNMNSLLGDSRNSIK